MTIRCNGDESSIDPAKRKSTERCTWIAFTTAAEYQVEDVTSGTHVSLVYHFNAVAKKVTVSKTKVDKGSQMVEKLDAVAAQLKKFPSVSRIGILLENKKYVPKDFTPASLKGENYFPRCKFFG